jgi:hypothetical protein
MSESGRSPGQVSGTPSCDAREYPRAAEPLLRASASLEVVTTIPVGQVADIVLDHVLRPGERSRD